MNIDEAIAKIEDIPTISAILGEILQITSSEKSSLKDLSRLIYADQAIATKVLKMANSSFYGFTQQVKSIDRAIVILGFDEVRSIAMAMSVFESIYLKKGGAYYNRLRSWNHSMLCGFGTRILADMFIKDKELEAELFVGGLIHDIGKVIIDRYFPKEFAKILELVEQESLSIEFAEREVLSFDHALIAGNLLKKWKFPDQLRDMVIFHHHPENAPHNKMHIALIFLADLMCHELGYSTFICESKPKIEQCLDSEQLKIMQEFGFTLTPENLVELMNKLKNHISKLENLSNMMLN